MTFTEVVSRVQKRTNQFSATAATRIGEEVNDVYKKVTASIGLDMTRRTEAQQTATPGSQFITFTGIEKIISVIDRSTGQARFLDEITVDELDRSTISASDLPTKYAIYRANSGSVQIKVNTTAQTAYTLYAPAYILADVLAGSQTPAFPESFHDILYQGALWLEYLHLEKPALADRAKADYEDRCGDLRIFIAKSPQQDIYQGKLSGSITQPGMVGSGGSGSGGGNNGTASYTQTGLITFDRTGAAPGSRNPFAVAVGSEKVVNLDADKLDGIDSSAFAQKAANETISGNWTHSGTFTANAVAAFTSSIGIGTTTPTPHDGSTIVGHVKSATYVDNLWRWELGTSGTPVTASTNAIFVRYDGFDTINTADPTLWTYGSFVCHTQQGGNGNRAAFVAQMQTSATPTRSGATNTVAVTALCFGTVTGGTYFGTNPYVRLSGSGAGASAIGEEIDTDCQVAPVDKIGLQIVDVATSTAVPSGRSAALRVVSQASGRGYEDGILFDNSPAAGVRTTLIRAVGGTYGRGLDLSAASFTGEAIYLPNNVYLAAKTSGGVATALLGMNGSNQVSLGAATFPVALLGGQLGFPATQAPSSDPNTLDDYEEGSWTPVIGGTGGTSGQTYTTQVGRYIKTGQLCICTFEALLSAKGTITTNVQIAGLPFLSRNTASLDHSGALRYGALATNWVNVIWLVTPNAQTALVRGAAAAAASNDTSLVTGDISNTTYFAGTITYFTNA